MHQSPVATSLPRPVYTPPSPTRLEEDDSSDDSGPTAQAEPKYHTQKEDLSDRYGDRSIQMEERSRSRPPVGPRKRTDEEETTLEKIWQPLFDSENRPTMRLAQFLRGVALHLIEDYEPKLSLVIPPHKMLRFYDEVSVPNEPYPWRDLFTRIRPDVLSRVYRSLGCAHHFIQDAANSQPSIPALTPAGFCQWLTLLIEAHPETEYQRLAMAVRDMPISNADDRRERFPKELSRRLFPRNHDSDIRHRCAAALLPPPPPGYPPTKRTSISDAMPAPQATTGAPRMSPPPASAPPPHAPSFAERERAPYSGSVPGGTSTAPTDSLPFRHDSAASTSSDVSSSSFASVSDTGPIPLERVTSMPIERERQPYTAREGQGKIYEASGGRGAGSDSTIKPPPPPPSAPPPQTSAPLSAVDPLKNGDFDERRRSRSYSQRYSMPPPPPPPLVPPPPPLASSSSDSGLRAHHYHQHHHGSLSSSSVVPPQPSPLATSSSASIPARSDAAPKRARSPTGSVGSSSNGVVPPSGVHYGGSGVLYSGSEDDEYGGGSSSSKRERDSERRERERELDELERRERERRKEERREREWDREREYERRERERDSKYRESEREREKLEYDRRERDRLERDRERAEREYRRQVEERERFVDDDVVVNNSSSNSHSQQQQHRRSMVGGTTNGFGPPPMGGALARGAY